MRQYITADDFEKLLKKVDGSVASISPDVGNGVIEVSGMVRIKPWRGPARYKVSLRNIQFNDDVFVDGFDDRKPADLLIDTVLFKKEAHITGGEHVSMRMTDSAVFSLELAVAHARLEKVSLGKYLDLRGMKTGYDITLNDVETPDMLLSALPGRLPSFIVTNNQVLARQAELARVPVFVTTETAAKMVTQV